LKQLENLGPKIRYYREQRGYTQEQLAQKLGKTKGYLSRIENGKERPNLELLANIADELKIRIKDLFDDETTPILPELRKMDADWIMLIKELKEEGFTVEEIREIVKLAKMFKDQYTKNLEKRNKCLY
jgi:transcriptional regulator with XRE-family HTH domain